MTSSDIRQSFLDFFRDKQHRIVDSAPVVPHDDPTLLFTNAGMNQFKDVFLGQGTRDYTRAADTQKCIRVSGKHNDLEEVGRDTYHHTFFEMLGNWSFGDYYKREAITWAWELLTEVWKLPKARLHATVYKDDDEAYGLWTELTDIDPAHVHRFGEKDNFWEMGDTGPCGPCSEIHVDLTEHGDGGALVNAGVPEVMEIWNLVFIQYNRDEHGTLHELPKKHIDTGMGFERICAVLQGKRSNYDTDVFMPVITRIAALAGLPYEGEQQQIAMRVIADHVRMLTFSIADGAIPGPDGRGYVLRRILRRAARFGRTLGMHEPFLYRVVETLCETMGSAFPEIVERREIIERVIRAEEESFNATLDRGLEIFDEIVTRLAAAGARTIAGADVFRLYDTFGFPLDLTNLLATERGLTIDEAGFETLLAAQKERSRAVTKKNIVFPTAGDRGAIQLTLLDGTDGRSAFTGYDGFDTEATVTGLREIDGQLFILLDRSPFYVESGGQVSDRGQLVAHGVAAEVRDLLKVDGGIVHVVSSEGGFAPKLGDTIHAAVDRGARRDTMRNHTATHLMHAAMRHVLGTHVQQAGSLVEPERLRFDFSHYEKVQDEQLAAIEAMVNEKILEGIPVRQHRAVPFEEARTMGALMFFGDKYGDFVNVLQVDEFSMEFCGGTHVHNTAEIGLFKIISEGSVASGTRRIEAVTGRGVLAYIARLQQRLVEGDLRESALHEQLRHAEKELARVSLAQGASQIDDLVARAEDWDGHRLAVARLHAGDAEQLKSLGDVLRERLKSGVGVLADVVDGKVLLVCVVTDDLVSRGVKAGAIVGVLAKKLGGGGGGRPHLATAGAKDTDGLDAVLAEAPALIRTMAAS
ncbi:MAG: alanine--tRNA ligase [Bacteroidota bacterium]|jgi:alanyl-tRNA synthetase|nr:alanine--tRNA ligase [Bacteroidota bacterium]